MDDFLAKAAAPTAPAHPPGEHDKDLQADDCQAAKAKMRARLSCTDTGESSLVASIRASHLTSESFLGSDGSSSSRITTK